MSVHQIFLDPEDDIVSIKDRLLWANESRVLLILPATGDLLTERVDLMLLRRFAGKQRIELGLVTRDSRVRNEARQVGVPVFSSTKNGEKKGGRSKKRPKLFHRPPSLHTDDRREAYRRSSPSPLWRRWLWRYAGITAFFMASSIILVSLLYAIPNATITLYPEIKPLQVKREIVADPHLESVNFSGASVPARRLTTSQQWQASVETTGVIEAPEASAKGRVLFVNTQESPVQAPAGTRVSSSGGQRIVFQTIQAVELPGALGATVEAEVVAIQPGAGGNLAEGLINRIEGPLAFRLEVRNLEPTSGGGNRLVRAVTDADMERLRAQLIQQLQILALAEMDGQLQSNEFLARDSLRVDDILQETFSHFAGEQSDRLTLEIQADLTATAVDKTQAIGLIYEQLILEVDTGFQLTPASLQFDSGDVLGVDNQGRVRFEMIGKGLLSAQLNLNPSLETIAGQPRDQALAYLNQQLPLRQYPTARLFPNWMGRMPYAPARIRAEIFDG